MAVSKRNLSSFGPVVLEENLEEMFENIDGWAPESLVHYKLPMSFWLR